MGGSGHAAVGAGAVDGGKTGPLLGEDKLVAIPLGLTIGLAISFALTSQWLRADVDEGIVPLEDQLMTSITDPIAVDHEELPAPDTLKAQLEEEYDGYRKAFLLRWLVIGVPMGLGIARIRRL